MIRRPPRSTLSSSSAASDVYKRQAKKTTDSVCWNFPGRVPAWTDHLAICTAKSMAESMEIVSGNDPFPDNRPADFRRPVRLVRLSSVVLLTQIHGHYNPVYCFFRNSCLFPEHPEKLFFRSKVEVVHAGIHHTFSNYFCHPEKIKSLWFLASFSVRLSRNYPDFSSRHSCFFGPVKTPDYPHCSHL